MTSIENIKRNQYIIVTGKKSPPNPPSPFPEGGIGILQIPMRSEPLFEPDGIPAKVVAVQPPFVMITDTDEQRICALDTRIYTLMVADRKYVKAFKDQYAKIRDPHHNHSPGPSESLLDVLRQMSQHR